MRKKFKVGDKVKLRNYRSWGLCEITSIYKETPRKYTIRLLDVDCTTYWCRIKGNELLEVKRRRNCRTRGNQ
jgi:hypothetical protein